MGAVCRSHFIAQDQTQTMIERQIARAKPQANVATQRGAFLCLSAFYFVYSARPEDWVPYLSYLPLAKITGAVTLVAALFSAGKTPRKIKDLPKEALYLLLLIGIMFVSAMFSPVWKGGAFFDTVDFAKVSIAWILTFVLVTTLGRFRRLVFIQAASVAVMCAVAIIKGHADKRLAGVIGGIYSNPNDLALAIVMSLPFCLAFLLTAKTGIRRAAWCLGIALMMAALFMTASRAGFIALVISGMVALWHIGIKGKRLALIVGMGLVGVLSFVIFGKTVMQRFSAISSESANPETNEALSSYEDRRFMIEKSLEAVERYPLLGVGTNCLITYSGEWREVHMSYLQMAAESGILALILYLLFLYRGFVNLKRIRRAHPDPETLLFAGALHSSLIGFIVGATFAPVAYHYFPYFTVCYTSVLAAMVAEELPAGASALRVSASPRLRFAGAYGSRGETGKG